MTWPSSDVNTTNADAGGDNPQLMRSDLLDLMQKFNLLRNHVSAFVQGLLSAANAAAARTTLGAATAGALGASGITGAAASGANSDITALNGLTSPISLVALRGYIDGFQMASSAANLTINAGVAVNSANAYPIALAAAITKTTGAWVVGTAQGGLDTGTIANSTWYHVFAIRRPDTGVVDVCLSVSPTAPTVGGAIPAAYTQYRRIGSVRTNGSAQWTLFRQFGDLFLWDATVLDVSTSSLGTTTTLYTLTVPTGVPVEVRFLANVYHAAVGGSVYMNAPAVSDEAAGGRYSLFTPVGGQPVAGQFDIFTNTAAQIQVVALNSSSTFNLTTIGWRDMRGKDA